MTLVLKGKFYETFYSTIYEPRLLYAKSECTMRSGKRAQDLEKQSDS